MTEEELMRLRELGRKLYDLKKKDYRVVVSYSLTEPAEPTYSIVDDDDHIIAWELSVNGLCQLIEPHLSE